MAGNPIQYTSRTYNSILSDIDSDPLLKDKPAWWKRCVAGIGDVLSMWNNAGANNAYLRPAFTRRAVADLVALLDYFPAGRSPSSGEILFFLDRGVSFPVTIAKEDLAATTQGSLAVSAKRFEARSQETIGEVTDTELFSDVDVANDKFTNLARSFLTGELVRLTTSGGLPGGLALATDYWVIRLSATEIRFSASLADAYAGTYIDILSQGTGTHTITLYSFRKMVYQQETATQYSPGNSDGQTAWQEFPLAHKGILEDTLVVVINDITWTKIDSWVDSLPDDTHFRLIFLGDGSAVLQFGDGVYGYIPEAFDIYVSCATGGGDDSNVSAANQVNLYAGTDSDVDGASNPSALTGGADEEDIEVSKKLAPLLLKARDRFVTSEDGEALALSYGGISLVNISRNQYGPLSCRIVGVATGGGNPSSALRTVVQAYLINKSILESTDTRFLEATITTVNVTSAAKMKEGYTYANVAPFFELAWQLFLSETGFEIKTAYDSGGVAAAVAKINSIFAASFGPADYAQIEELVSHLDYADFGKDRQESDIMGYVDAFVFGVDYITIAVPSFPVAVAGDEITTDGALTLTEIP